MHAVRLRADSIAPWDKVAEELSPTLWYDARKTSGHGRIEPQRLFYNLIQKRQQLDLVVVKVGGEGRELAHKFGLCFGVAAY